MELYFSRWQFRYLSTISIDKLVITYLLGTYYYYFRWTDCKGSCGETGYTSRYRSTTSSDVLCEFNHEWKTCHILGCIISNYTKSAEGNELRTRELNYILQRARNANRMVIDAFFSDNCNYYALKNVFTNNIVSLKFKFYISIFFCDGKSIALFLNFFFLGSIVERVAMR